jgi:hypothetical protein
VELATAPGDCNTNGLPDALDILLGRSEDAIGDELPDECVPPVVELRRGDANSSSDVDISDAVTVLLQLFSGAPVGCADASDTNDDGDADISDAIFLLDSLFRSGQRLPEPSPLCGQDPTLDGLDCAAYGACP